MSYRTIFLMFCLPLIACRGDRVFLIPDADGVFHDADGLSTDGDISDGDYTEAALQVPFELEVSGQGNGFIGSVQFTQNVGQIELAPQVTAFAYEVTEWTDFNLTLYHVLAPTASSLHVMYLYCDYITTDGLDYIWHESFDHPMDYQTASGTCVSTERDIEVVPFVPILEAVPASDQINRVFSVLSPEVDIYQGEGTFDGGDRSFEVFVFEVVDCTEECTSQPIDGWWELHSILVDAESDEKCFGIFYLFVNSATLTLLGYGFCLESLSPLPQVFLDAQWSRDESLPSPPPPPTMLRDDSAPVFLPRPEPIRRFRDSTN